MHTQIVSFIFSSTSLYLYVHFKDACLNNSFSLHLQSITVIISANISCDVGFRPREVVGVLATRGLPGAHENKIY